ncbi:hypothetical protein IWW45_008330, partial [Coemansia sp. RSA 485]
QYVSLPLVPSNRSLAKQTWLLPLMNVCKQWHFTTRALFYQSALLTNKRKVHWIHEHKRILWLDEVIAAGRQQNLKRLQIIIAPSDLKSPEASTMLLRDALDRCGPLTGVREASILFVHNDAMRPYLSYKVPEFEETAGLGSEADVMACFQKNIEEYVALFNQLLPNRFAFNVCKTRRYGCDPLETEMAERLFCTLPKLLGSRICHFMTSNLSMSKQLIGDLDGISLKRISILQPNGLQKYIELIRRNAATLEMLQFRHVTTVSVAKITFNGRKRGTLIYPCLKELRISSCTGRRSFVNQPECDPFPALKSLYCRGPFPFSAPVVLDHGRKHISNLGIEVDAELLAILDGHNILEAGSFAKSNRVSLGWNHRNYRPRGDHANQIFIKALNLSGAAGTVGNTYLYVDDFTESVLPKITFSNSLCLLNLEGTYLTMNEAIKLLCGFKNLRVAGVSLKDDSEHSTLRMPAVDELQKYQRELKGYSSSSLQLLNVRHAEYRNVRRAAEFLVLMTSIVTSIST